MNEQRFLQMLQRHKNALSSKQIFSGLLMDYFPQERMLFNLMTALFEMGIHTEIDKTREISNIFAYRFAKRLMDEYGISRENADNTVRLFCKCYGKGILNKPCDWEDKQGLTPPPSALPVQTPTPRSAQPHQTQPVQTSAPKPAIPLQTKHMTNLGKKWTCFSCGVKFYDFLKSEAICPKCSANQKNAQGKAQPVKTPATRPAPPIVYAPAPSWYNPQSQDQRRDKSTENPWITVLKAIGLIVIIPLIILAAFGGKGTGFGGSSAGRKRRRNRNGGGFF
jgi:hypothetical protein